MTLKVLVNLKSLILPTNKILALDTYYYSDNDAYTVGILFLNWQDKKPQNIVSCHTSEFAPYIPGEFYKRELPGVLDLIDMIDMSEVGTIILDGFVWLPDNTWGLGMHLWERLGFLDRLNILGLAKTKFSGCEDNSLPIFRNKSTNPLWINTNHPDGGKGKIGNQEAVERIKQMHGKGRLPDLLKLLDIETKKYVIH